MRKRHGESRRTECRWTAICCTAICGTRRAAAMVPLLAGLLGALALQEGKALGAEEVFADITAKAGIRFQHVNGAAGKKHLYETMIGGAGWLDFDGDGFLDLY